MGTNWRFPKFGTDSIRQRKHPEQKHFENLTKFYNMPHFTKQTPMRYQPKWIRISTWPQKFFDFKFRTSEKQINQ